MSYDMTGTVFRAGIETPAKFDLAWPEFIRFDALKLSAATGLVAMVIGGGVILTRLSDLPNVDTLFTPQLVQPTPDIGPRTQLAVLRPVTAGEDDINLAPTPPVFIDPYPASYDVLPATSDYAPPAYAPAAYTAPEETAAPVMTRAEVRGNTSLTQALASEAPSAPQNGYEATDAAIAAAAVKTGDPRTLPASYSSPRPPAAYSPQ
jgi:hypothetical protein